MPDYAKGGEPTVHRLKFGEHELIVHRNINHRPEQWVCTCFRLGVENRPVGDPGADVQDAKRLAIKLVKRRLIDAAAALRVACK